MQVVEGQAIRDVAAEEHTAAVCELREAVRENTAAPRGLRLEYRELLEFLRERVQATQFEQRLQGLLDGSENA